MLSLKSGFEKPMWNRVGCIHLSCTAYDLKSTLTFPSIKNSPSILKVQYVKYHRCTGEKFSFLLFPMQMHIASYFGLCKTNISYCHSCVVSVGCLLFISDRVYVSLLWSEPELMSHGSSIFPVTINKVQWLILRISWTFLFVSAAVSVVVKSG